jgi:hypothetical protein
MAEFTKSERSLDRRGFLRGSALFAAAVGLTSVAGSAFAQDQQPKSPVTPEEEKKAKEAAEAQAKKEQAPKAGGSSAPAEDPNKLVDVNGLEYRVCDRCGGTMYKEASLWTCEQCGFSYSE